MTLHPTRPGQINRKSYGGVVPYNMQDLLGRKNLDTKALKQQDNEMPRLKGVPFSLTEEARESDMPSRYAIVTLCGRYVVGQVNKVMCRVKYQCL